MQTTTSRLTSGTKTSELRVIRRKGAGNSAATTVGPVMTFLGTESVRGETLVWLSDPRGARQRITEAAFTDEYVAYPFVAAVESGNRDFATANANEQQAKLERTILSALAKRDAWQMGRITEPGYVYATLDTGDYRGFIGNHRGGTWWWEVFNSGLLVAHGRFPAGPTSNMRSAESAIADHRARNGGA